MLLELSIEVERLVKPTWLAISWNTLIGLNEFLLHKPSLSKRIRTDAIHTACPSVLFEYIHKVIFAISKC